MDWDVASIVTTGSDPQVNDSDWTSESIAVSDANPYPGEHWVLLAIKDLFTALPITANQVTSATLTLTASSGDYASLVGYRVTTGWLLHDAGESERYVTGHLRNCPQGGPWAQGIFGSGDYDDTPSATYTLGSTFPEEVVLDVTDQVKAMYSISHNYGWCATNVDSGDADVSIYNPGGGGPVDFYPTLHIEYTDTGSYPLTVSNGTGSSTYDTGTTVQIAADTPPTGQSFLEWTGDACFVGDAYMAETTLVMPPRSVEITAKYGIPLIWIRQFGTEEHDLATAVCVDPDGNAIVGGATQGDLVDGMQIGTKDMFIRKYDPNGQVLWTDQRGPIATSPLSPAGIGVSADPFGHIYFFGTTDARFDDNETLYGGQDIFFGKYEPSGELLWSKQVGSTADDHGESVFARSNGFCIGGCTQGDLYQPLSGYWDCYVARYSDSGEPLWCDQYGMGTGTQTISEWRGAAVSGHVYLCGSSDEGPSFSPVWTHFVRRYGSSGIEWVDTFDANEWQLMIGSVTDSSDNLYVAGNAKKSIAQQTYAGAIDVYLRKYSYNSEGDAEWTAMLGTGQNDLVGRRPSIDGLGSIYFAGSTNGLLGARTSGDFDVFLAKYTTSGDYVCVSQFGTGEEDMGYEAATDEWGNTYVVGSTYGSFRGFANPDPGETRDAFIAKFGLSYSLTVNSGSGGGTYPGGTIVEVAADVAPSGQCFLEWTGDTATVDDADSAETTITMPAADAEITATYTTAYALTVNSGSGDGSYAYGTVVEVAADTPPGACRFLEWSGDTAGVAATHSAETTIEMPAGDVEITAEYTLIADRSGDGFVGQADLDILLGVWGQHVTAGSAGDPSGDGFVGQADLDMILSYWGSSYGGEGMMGGGQFAASAGGGGEGPLESATFEMSIDSFETPETVDLVGPEYGGTTIPADTYVTNDIVVTSDTDWLSAQLILEPDDDGDIFQHPAGFTSSAPSPVYLEYFPAMAYDTYVSDGSGGSANGVGPVDLYEGECDVVFDDDLLQIAWCSTSHDDTGELSLARITLANDATGTWVFVVTADPAEGPKILAEGTIEDGVLVPDEEE